MNGQLAPRTAALQAALAELEACGADRFNPVRFHYIKAMVRRSLEQRSNVAAIIASKAGAALASYQTELATAQIAAENQAQRLGSQQPALASRIQAMLDAYEYKALSLLEQTLQPAPRPSALHELLCRLDREAQALNTKRQPSSLAEALHMQEQELVSSFTDSTGRDKPPARATTELRSTQQLRATIQQQRADKLVRTALQESTTESGPLNAQKLVLSSLAIMQELSPAYLRRFVSYVDTLFWLEKAGPGSTGNSQPKPR